MHNYGASDFEGVAGSVFGDFAFLDAKWGDARRGTPAGTITWSFTSASSALAMTSDAARAAVFLAFDAWAQFADITFQHVPDGSDADIQFAWEFIDGADEVLGYAELETVWRGDELERIEQVNIRIDRSDFAANPVNDQLYENVILHEIGHALGLGHVSSANELMYAYADADAPNNKGGQEGVQFLYGSGSGKAATFFAGFDDANDVFDNSGFDTSLRAFGLAGNDQIIGGNGADQIYSGLGNDILRGGQGNDRLQNSFGNDRLDGEAGNDQLSSFGGETELNGGDGNDVIRAGAGDDTLRGGAGNDQLFGDAFAFRNLGGDDYLDGGAGNDTLSGGAGSDIFVFRANEGASNRITDFEPGFDTLDLRSFGFASQADVLGSFTAGSSLVFADQGTGIVLVGVLNGGEIIDDILW